MKKLYVVEKECLRVDLKRDSVFGMGDTRELFSSFDYEETLVEFNKLVDWSKLEDSHLTKEGYVDAVYLTEYEYDEEDDTKEFVDTLKQGYAWY